MEGQVAIVTGAAGKIGSAICLRLLAEGCRLVLVDLNTKRCAELKAEIESLGGMAITCIGDLLNPSFFDQVLELTLSNFGQINILVNNAGMGSEMKPLWEIDITTWEKDIAINLTSQFLMCKAVIPHMIKQGYGRIVNIASSAGMEGHALSGGYAAAKAGVIAMTKTLGKELAQKGIIVNAIAPALIETDMLNADWFDVEVKNNLLSRIPMGRLGKAQEVAEMVCFLSSSKVSFSTGAVFDLSGGRATY
ncbi:SDR family NAD(P)-dependent oxidoreductase [Acinetobacter chengduensis]|uniref:SDR family oxidoreductase n=1 Tax=Acinetobacter chengduensis TaxID=2420890 RepID=A0ABX9TWX8_9GAMM|nr:SDR family NAD(P)-dependent oxidoreductase [Acinetobacter chengduensis]RLL21813.1 SDR family oxidoreductase [Acinetobacter chengduensis]